MQKTANVDFYTLEIESTGLETILRDLHRTPADSPKRNVEHNDDWIRLARGRLTDQGYLGDLMRISMAPAGFRADLAGKVDATPAFRRWNRRLYNPLCVTLAILVAIASRSRS